MTDLARLFDSQKPNPAKLLAFGFIQTTDGYVYRSILPKTRFQITVEIGAGANLPPRATLQDPQSGGAYVLHQVPGASGKFVGQVRLEYEAFLTRVVRECFEKDIFQSQDAKSVIAYAREKYGDELEFLWEIHPHNAILRRKDTQKWYAALLVLPKAKLGIAGEGFVDILDVRAETEVLEQLVDSQHYFPGYHMNKKHWLTLCLDGRLPLPEIFKRIDDSYALAVK